MMNEGEPKKASHLQAVRAVFWSFFGVRRNRDYQSDAINLTMPQVIVSGIIGAILFVATLVLVVYFVTR
jgi:hypothetical protein